VRVFTITHIEFPFKLYGHRSSSLLLCSPVSTIQVGSYGPIITGGEFKHLQCKPETCRPFCCTVILLHLLQNKPVVSTVGDNCYRFVVLGCTAKHRGTANINIFYGIFEGDVGFCHGCFKGVEINNNQINKIDAVLLCLAAMVSILPNCKKTSVYFGMQGFYPSIHDFGESGDC